MAEPRLIAFAKELMVELACDSPKEFRAWFNQARDDVIAVERGETWAARRNEPIERHWRAMIQAAAHLPDATALEVLTEGARNGTSLSRTEADIHATDKVVRLLLQRGGSTDLMNNPQFKPYYADAKIPRLRRLGRILELMSQIGPDNTHPDEYRSVWQSAATACLAILAEGPLTESEITWLSQFIYDERDRYFFNGNLEGMKRFFSNPARGAFLPISDHLEHGGVLRHEDITVLQPYISRDVPKYLDSS